MGCEETELTLRLSSDADDQPYDQPSCAWLSDASLYVRPCEPFYDVSVQLS